MKDVSSVKKSNNRVIISEHFRLIALVLRLRKKIENCKNDEA